MSELMEMIASLKGMDLFFCAICVVILDFFAFAVIVAVNREGKLCQKRWQKLSSQMELRHGDYIYPLEADEILIGRHISADIRIPDPSVSRYHAVMTVSGGIWTITDLGTKSGIYINEQRVQHSKLLPGDRIRLGNTTLYMEKTGESHTSRRRRRVSGSSTRR